MNDDIYSSVRADAYFAMIPEWVLDASLSPSAVVVYCTLARYANRESRTCYPSKETIAERAGLSLNTVSRCLAELKEVGAISSKRRNINGIPTSNVYILHMVGPNGVLQAGNEVEALVPNFEALVPNFEAHLPNSGTRIRQSNQTKRTRNISPSSEDDEEKFQQFWSVYPKRKDVAKARVAFKKALSKASLEVIVAGAQRYAQARLNKDPQFTKLPTSWLNAQAWLDEPDPVFVSDQNQKASMIQGALDRLNRKELGA